MFPIYNTDPTQGKMDEITKYQISSESGEDPATVWVNYGYVHFIVDGNRYRLKLSTGVVDRLVIGDMNAYTVDFSTQYNPTHLRDNLVLNVKNAMLNQIVQAVIDSTNTDYASILVSAPKLGNYLDMFNDSFSLNVYSLANSLESDAEECHKFSEVFKNSLVELNKSNATSGNIYQYLLWKMTNVFADKNQVTLVDEPSIQVTRVEEQEDVFAYNVYMDVHLVQNKEWMQKHAQDGKYVIANATVKDMKCSVEFTPKYDDFNGNITYDVVYSVDPGSSSKEYVAKYNQIAYSLDGKIKQRTVSEKELSIEFSDLGLDFTISETGKELENIT
jgi:hypothetical protein